MARVMSQSVVTDVGLQSETNRDFRVAGEMSALMYVCRV